jgi:AcrR family transcriptional regulator
MPVKSWKREQVIGTRDHLIETAGKLFGERGYAGTPLEEVVARAGLTRGAVYHHFKDKRSLFEAVVDRVLLDLVNDVERRTVRQAVARGEEREADAIEFFVEALCDGPTHRILSVEGPSVIGRERWSQLMGERLLDPVRRVVEQGVAVGNLDASLVPGVTHLLFGAVQEAALQIGQCRADTPESETTTKPEIDAALGWLLGRILEPH